MPSSLQSGINYLPPADSAVNKASKSITSAPSSDFQALNSNSQANDRSLVTQGFARQLDQQIEQSQKKEFEEKSQNGNVLPQNQTLNQSDPQLIKPPIKSILNQDTNPQLNEELVMTQQNSSVAALVEGVDPVILPTINPNSPPIIAPKPIEVTTDSILDRGANAVSNEPLVELDEDYSIEVNRLPPEITNDGNLLADFQQNTQNGNMLPAMDLPGGKTTMQRAPIVLQPVALVDPIIAVKDPIVPIIVAKDPKIIAPYVMPRDPGMIEQTQSLPNIKTVLEKGFNSQITEFSVSAGKEGVAKQFMADGEQKFAMDDLKGKNLDGKDYLSENKLLINNLKTTEQINGLQNNIALKEISSLANNMGSSLLANQSAANTSALLEPIPTNITQSAPISPLSSTPSAVSPINNLLSPFAQGLQLRNEFTPNLSARIQWIQQQAMSSAEILMDPPELGPLTVKLTNHNGETQIQFQVNNTQTKEMIEDNLSKLKEMLAEQGISLGDTHVEQQNKDSKDNHSTDSRSSSPFANTNSVNSDDQVITTQEVVQQGLLDTYI